MSSIVSEKYAFVIGVDTHAATHAFALVAGKTGAVLDGSEFPTTAAGLARPELAGPAGSTAHRHWSSSRAPDRMVPS